MNFWIVPRHAHLSRLDLRFLSMLGEEYNAYSSALCNFFHSPVISSLLAPNIFLSILFSNTLNPRVVAWATYVAQPFYFCWHAVNPGLIVVGFPNSNLQYFRSLICNIPTVSLLAVSKSQLQYFLGGICSVYNVLFSVLLKCHLKYF